MGRLYRYDKGGQGGGTSASMEERISWLLAQGKIMLNLYQRAPTPTDKERVKGELDSLYKQLTEIYPVLSRQRRYQELLTLQQIQLEIIRIFKRQQAEGVLLASIGATYLVLRQYTKAQHFLEQAVPILQATENQAYLCYVLHNLGEVCRLTERYGEALRLYDQALAIDPNRPSCWFVKGYVLERMGRREEAITSYKHTLQLKPDFGSAREALSRLGVPV